MNLFNLDTNTGDLIISEPAILSDVVYNRVYMRNPMLMTLVWWVADNRSPLVVKGLDRQTKIEEACRRLEISPISIDKEVNEAIDKYESDFSSLSAIALNTARMGLNTAIIITNKLIEEINKEASKDYDEVTVNNIIVKLTNIKKLNREFIDGVADLKGAEGKYVEEQLNIERRAGGELVPPSAKV